MAGVDPTIAEYLHGYPRLGDIPEWRLNFQFYKDQRVDFVIGEKPGRLSVNDVHRYIEEAKFEWFTQPHLERQAVPPTIGCWMLFPIRDRGFTPEEIERQKKAKTYPPGAEFPQPLQPSEMAAMQRDPDVQRRFWRSVVFFMSCLGFYYMTEPAKKFVLDRNREVVERRSKVLEKHANSVGKWVSRMLKAMGEIGFENMKFPIIRVLTEAVYDERPTAWASMKSALHMFWAPLLREQADRNATERLLRDAEAALAARAAGPPAAPPRTEAEAAPQPATAPPTQADPYAAYSTAGGQPTQPASDPSPAPTQSSGIGSGNSPPPTGGSPTTSGGGGGGLLGGLKSGGGLGGGGGGGGNDGGKSFLSGPSPTSAPPADTDPYTPPLGKLPPAKTRALGKVLFFPGGDARARGAIDYFRHGVGGRVAKESLTTLEAAILSEAENLYEPPPVEGEVPRPEGAYVDPEAIVVVLVDPFASPATLNLEEARVAAIAKDARARKVHVYAVAHGFVPAALWKEPGATPCPAEDVAGLLREYIVGRHPVASPAQYETCGFL